MSYSWSEVDGQEWSNRARYNLYCLFKLYELPTSTPLVEGVTPRTIYNFMSGRNDTTISTLAKIADFFEIPLTKLFMEIPEKPLQQMPPSRFRSG